jgi:transcriptional regulator with XRE-family HTH domain
MNVRRIQSSGDLGPIIRALRKARGLRQDDAAGSIGVSENFLAKLERGGERVQFDKLLLVLDEMGIELVAHYPSEAELILKAPEPAQRNAARRGKDEPAP